MKQLGEGCFDSKYTLDNDLLKKKPRLMVGLDLECKRKLLSLYHEGVMEEHSGSQATYKRLHSVFHWLSIERDVC